MNNRLAAIDPRVRVFTAFALSLLLVLPGRSSALVAGLALGIILVAASGLPWRDLWPRLKAVNLFLLALACTLPWSVGATGLAFRPEGAGAALIIAARTNAVCLCAAALLHGLDTFTIGAVLADLGLPPKFVRLFLLTARYLGLLGDTAARLKRAMRARGFRPGANLHTWRTYANLVGMLLVSAIARAERVEAAMKCRGFPSVRQVSRERQRWRFADVAAGLTMVACGAALSLWR
jgi:cobalt/nickel transport system permease protein